MIRAYEEIVDFIAAAAAFAAFAPGTAGFTLPGTVIFTVPGTVAMPVLVKRPAQAGLFLMAAGQGFEP